MNTKTFFTGVGATVLAICTDIAVQASAKSSPSTIYVSTASGGCRALVVSLTSSMTFTTGGTGNQATITTWNGTLTRGVWATSSCAAGAKPVHFHG